ncbi:hypothetical protein F5887DRAFT_979234 [Amanita rubescens]|nr:hypothetical protein F5887DRAFT_979234 [Amanita rubescens]
MYEYYFTNRPDPGLFAVSIRQALFIAPCSHIFHYKCIKPLLEAHHPGFSCSLRRTYADLEADIGVEPTTSKSTTFPSARLTTMNQTRPTNQTTQGSLPTPSRH